MLTHMKNPAADAFEAYVRDLVHRFVDERAKELATPRVYSQRDGELPVGCGRIRYIRLFNAAEEASEEGLRREGRAMLMTEACWLRLNVARERKRSCDAPSPVASEDVEARLMREIGLRRKP